MIHPLWIAGVAFAIDCDASAEAWRTIARGLDGFEAPAGDSDVRIRVEIDPSASPFLGERALPTPRPDGFAGEDYEVRREGQELIVRQPLDAFGLSMAIKMTLSELLLQRGAVLVHGVCVAEGGRAALFSGPSGAGKSTLGHWAKSGGLRLLADELVALRRTEGEVRVEGTPWNIGAPAEARLSAVGILAHAPDHRIEDVPPTEVLRVLTTNILLPDEAPQTRHRAFEIARAALTNARCVRLHFARDEGVAATLRTLL